ncbi:hypothetical protein ACGFWD_44065 [Streptomyces sp. NPDC048448]|uniref:hypothetical protein n=1 Tax=Streptomyces sp. NPDC048448 TaxID=3365554 RepID=UPI0037189538
MGLSRLVLTLAADEGPNDQWYHLTGGAKSSDWLGAGGEPNGEEAHGAQEVAVIPATGRGLQLEAGVERWPRYYPNRRRPHGLVCDNLTPEKVAAIRHSP